MESMVMGQAGEWPGQQNKTEHGGAALTLVEALLLVLVERNILREEDVDEVFEAAIAAHEKQGQEAGDPDGHAKISRILKRIHVHGNAVRLD